MHITQDKGRSRLEDRIGKGLTALMLYICISPVCLAINVQTDPNVIPNSSIQNLGNQKYKIGPILIDKANKQFQVSGRILRLEPPLEFLAVAKDGQKGYESLLELEANAFEFNLACILIGLDSDKAKKPAGHFDPAPVEGQEVKITLNWGDKGAQKSVNAGDIFLNDGNAATSGNWVYIGSHFLQGFYQADQFGTLIGFVHAPESIIEHSLGIGLSNYGGVTVDAAKLPQKDATITLEVTYIEK